jgi:hypothetical protein
MGMVWGQEAPAPLVACAGEVVEREFEYEIGHGVFRQNVPVFTVPEGKRLVVEQVTLFARLGSGSGLVGELVAGSASRARVTTRFPVKAVEGGYQETWYVANTWLRAYARAGERVWMGLWRQSAFSNGLVQGTLTGCLLPAE